MKSLASLALLASFALASVACAGPHYSDNIVDTIVKPTGGAIDFDNTHTITVPLGGAIKAHVVSYDSDKKRMSGAITSDNASVLTVSNVITGDDDWAFLGTTAGTTVIHLVADGVVVRDITATVVDVQDTTSAIPNSP